MEPSRSLGSGDGHPSTLSHESDYRRSEGNRCLDTSATHSVSQVLLRRCSHLISHRTAETEIRKKLAEPESRYGIDAAVLTARHDRGQVTLHLPEGWHREQERMTLFAAACGPGELRLNR